MSPSVTPVRPKPLDGTAGVRVPAGTLALLRDLIHARVGMFYDDSRLDVVGERLIPLAIARGFDSLLDYYYLLKYDAGAVEDWSKAVDALAVQETYFWREQDQIRALADQIVPHIAPRDRPLRIWSLPCASGEEPLSLAMALNEAHWFLRRPIEIHAADASRNALRKARAGRYSGRSFRQLPDALRAKYFEHDPQQDSWTISPAVHQRVTSWREINVACRGDLDVLEGADVIFCRNLFIYFREDCIRRVVDAFADLMSSPAFLCVGAAESLLRLTSRFELQDVGGAHVYVKP